MKRRPQEHGERQDDDQQEVHEEDCRREPAPAPKVDLARTEALAGHGGVLRSPAGKPRDEVHPGGRDREERHRVCGGEAHLAGVAVHRLVDGRGENLDPHRETKERRHLE